jgi:hypothetical protein
MKRRSRSLDKPAGPRRPKTPKSKGSAGQTGTRRGSSKPQPLGCSRLSAVLQAIFNRCLQQYSRTRSASARPVLEIFTVGKTALFVCTQTTTPRLPSPKNANVRSTMLPTQTVSRRACWRPNRLFTLPILLGIAPTLKSVHQEQLLELNLAAYERSWACRC